MQWIKKTDIKRNGDDIPILPLTNTVNIYQFSDKILNHIPKDALKTIENDHLYSKKKVVINSNNVDYKTAANAANRTDVKPNR